VTGADQRRGRVFHPRAAAIWRTSSRFLLVAGALPEEFAPADGSVVPISVSDAGCGEDACDAIGSADDLLARRGNIRSD
jgi:hypothetical protein